MKVLILMLELTTGQGRPLGKDAALFQEKAEPWNLDIYLSPENEAPLTFKRLSAENEAPLTFKRLSAGNEASLTFKRLSAENEAPLTFKRLSAENETPLTFKHLSAENEAPFTAEPLSTSNYQEELSRMPKQPEENLDFKFGNVDSKLISKALHLKEYKEIAITSEVNVRKYNFKYDDKLDFAVGDDDDNDEDDDEVEDYFYHDENIGDDENWMMMMMMTMMKPTQFW
ncbi:uncharacterized protein LOC144664183 [Oculina patagonica]